MKTRPNFIKNKYLMPVGGVLIIIVLIFILSKYSYHNKLDNLVESTSTEITQEETTMFEKEETSDTESMLQTQELLIQTTVAENNIAASQEKIYDQDFVSNLDISNSVTQLIIVAAFGNQAEVTMHEKAEDGNWIEILNTTGFVGENGVGQASEYDTKTPAGVYTLSFAFGIKDNPGTNFQYTKVDSSYYWVDDVGSVYYNKFVTTNNVIQDWSSAEHIIDYTKAYSYVIPIDYNINCVKGQGSAMFLHVSTGSPTGGCVSVPETDMVFILTHIKQNCVILIDNADNINKY